MGGSRFLRDQKPARTGFLERGQPGLERGSVERGARRWLPRVIEPNRFFRRVHPDLPGGWADGNGDGFDGQGRKFLTVGSEPQNFASIINDPGDVVT